MLFQNSLKKNVYFNNSSNKSTIEFNYYLLTNVQHYPKVNQKRSISRNRKQNYDARKIGDHKHVMHGAATARADYFIMYMQGVRQDLSDNISPRLNFQNQLNIFCKLEWILYLTYSMKKPVRVSYAVLSFQTQHGQ